MKQLLCKTQTHLIRLFFKMANLHKMHIESYLTSYMYLACKSNFFILNVETCTVKEFEREGVSKHLTASVVNGDLFSHVPQGESEVDVIAEQLKFRACLKILMTELRTLATGFEVDGGKLRFQLYSWLEKEIAAMHKICNYKVSCCLRSASDAR